MREQCFEQLAPELQPKTGLEATAVMHCDESVHRINRILWRLHVASTAQLTILLCVFLPKEYDTIIGECGQKILGGDLAHNLGHPHRCKEWLTSQVHLSTREVSVPGF